MDRRLLDKSLADYAEAAPSGLVSADAALRPELAGLRMYEAPLTGVADAADPLFTAFRRPEVIGPHFRPPGEWLAGARAVIAVFLPFAEAVVRSNRSGRDCPSDEWLHARIEGQELVNAVCRHCAEMLTKVGYTAAVPSLSSDFASWRSEPGPGGIRYTSNWSERHAAYAAGLGTFGLSAGLITRRGMAGRIGSVITDAPLIPDPRPYSRYDEYCTRCGACEARCPANAVSETQGRDKAACARFIDTVLAKNAPRYGCGKCQTGVPCERRIPAEVQK